MKSSKLLLFLILLIATVLRFYKIADLYPFIGDQGWFYLSAKDLLAGHIPLVGITASYTWLHQGALWTYLLAPVLWIFHFNPIGGAYLSAFLGVLSVFMIYIVGRTLFENEKVGLASAFLFAVSPLVIIYSRMPYHTSPIALVTLVFIYSLYKYSAGSKNYLIATAFMLGLLYNLELATMIFWILTAIIVVKVRKIDFKLFFLSLIFFLIPLIPMIIYDFQAKSGFYQTTAFFRLIKISIFNHSTSNPETFLSVLTKILIYNQRLVFLGNKFIAFISIVSSVLFLIWNFIKNKSPNTNYGVLILSFWVGLSFLGILLSKTPSEAYLHMFYPGIILLVAYSAIKITEINTSFKPIIYSLIILFSIINVYFLLTTLYLTKGTGFTSVSQKLKIAKEIVEVSNGKKYNLISKGEGSQFSNNLKNYEYLTWWVGNQASEKNETIKFSIEERNGIINLKNE